MVNPPPVSAARLAAHGGGEVLGQRLGSHHHQEENPWENHGKICMVSMLVYDNIYVMYI